MSRKIALLAVLSMAACSIEPGAGRPAPKGKDPLTIDGAGQEISLDATRVPVVPVCDNGQLVRKSADGWECAEAAGLRVAWESVTGKPATTPWSQVTVPGTTVWPGHVLLDRVDGATESLGQLQAALVAAQASLAAQNADLQRQLADARSEIECNVSLDGLAAYLPMDGNLDDASGNDTNPEGEGGPTFVSGKFGQAVNLNGTSQFVRLFGGWQGKFFMLEGLTMAAWIKFSGVTSQKMVMGKHQAGVTGGYFLAVNPTGPSALVGTDSLAHTASIADNTWHHLAATWNPGIQRLALFVDGQIVGSVGAGGSPGTSQVIEMIGNIAGTDYKFPGALDEVSLWTRALSPLEIAALAGCPLR